MHICQICFVFYSHNNKQTKIDDFDLSIKNKKSFKGSMNRVKEKHEENRNKENTLLSSLTLLKLEGNCKE